MINQKFGVAMALALSLGVGSVQAADFKSYISKGQCGTSPETTVDDGDVISKPLEYAVEQFGTADVPLAMPFRVRYTLSNQLTDQFYVNYTLTGGATWGENLTTTSFQIQNADGTPAPTATAPLVAIVKGGKNTESSVSFIVQAGPAPAAATTAHILDFQFKVGKAQKALANYGQLGITVNFRLAATAADNPTAPGKDIDTAKTLILAKSGDGASIDLIPPTKSTAAYISVEGDGKIFEGSAITAPNTTTLVDYGEIEIKQGDGLLASTSPLPLSSYITDTTSCPTLNGTTWSPCDSLESLDLSIENGNFTASTKDDIYIDLGTGATPLSATEKLSDNITAKWAITDGDQLDSLCGEKRKIMLKVDGVTEINENRKVPPTGTLTVKFGDKTMSRTAKLRHLKKNGSVCTLYNIPNSTALDRLNIRITNGSTKNGFVKGSLRGEDGADIFRNATLIPAEGLVPNQTVRLTSAELIAAAVAAGKTEWTGRAVLTLESNVPEGSMEAYGLLRAATVPFPEFTDSPLMNMSVGATGNGCD